MKTTGKTIITLLIIMLACVNSYAENINRPESDNYINGVTALNNGDIETAYNLLNAEIENNPENGYAHCYMSLICNACNDMVLAMQAVNSSLELIPEDDKEYRSFAYYTRSILWGNLGKWDNAINDMSESIKLNPNDAESFKTRAEMYVNTKHYEEAIEDVNRVLSLDKDADVTDLMMKLIQSVPTEELAEKVTNIMGLMSLK
ncbi:tetratricopeptide repeat protein [Bacteroides caecigallinarum]|uniref:tetratricopeptide repeat protein n=1 Tax=Bacteroides caecigallinarum TaxID=1411144 RepID=UPI001F172E45|nr:tetratricopeptide repeat protein [Bacteroides caecigallinarum]MCF2737481.1 tetratricopeptide repeat protein [Bacteroides caecigallinarum]MDN0072123.1 tetratricopeptide repeat protein [Bacteroides caecigallinarum]